jgi:YHS domain-containing protein
MTGRLMRDPVCGMEFSSNQAATTTQWKGKTYYFCCRVCRAAFEEDPRRFTGPEEEKA